MTLYDVYIYNRVLTANDAPTGLLSHFGAFFSTTGAGSPAAGVGCWGGGCANGSVANESATWTER